MCPWMCVYARVRACVYLCATMIWYTCISIAQMYGFTHLVFSHEEQHCLIEFQCVSGEHIIVQIFFESTAN